MLLLIGFLLELNHAFLQQVPYIEHQIIMNLRHADPLKKAKHFSGALRPSQSLHCRFLKSNPKDASKVVQPRPLDEITVCIIYKRKKIEFQVKHKTSFSQLNQLLYSQLHSHLISSKLNMEKVERVMRSVVGFQSVDGDLNFDYRLSLNKGELEKTKFFYPFTDRSAQDTLRYKIYNCLAIGGFSKVYLARSYENGQFYAIKFIRKVQGDDLHERQKYESLKNEMEVSMQLDHPFLVKLLQAFQTSHFYCMVFEYCPGGELFYLLKKVKMMSQAMAKFYFLQILYGIQYLHSKNIIYRDLKPQNILIDADGNCKIVDFGLSKKIDSRSKTFSYCGSAEYMAPEMILRTGHSFGIDYYSLGALLYELVTGLPPYYTKNHDQLQESIICKEITFPQHIQLSSQIKDLLQRLLKKDEKYRLGSYIGIKEIIFHPWIGKVKSTAILGKEMRVPFAPNLEDYNFDTTQLGDDEEEFTALVHEDVSESPKKLTYYKQHYKSNIFNHYCSPYVTVLLAERQQSKQNDQPPKKPSLSSLKRNHSKERLKSIVCSHNILERIENNASLEKSFRANNTVQERRTRNICKLYPYLNCQKVSPKKQKDIINFIEHKILKIDRMDHGKKLKRIRIEKNRLDPENSN